MARPKRKSLQQMQREKLKRQRSLTRTKPSTPASQRVEKVKVKVEPQKQLKGSKTTRALPPGKKGGPVSTGNRPRRTNVNKPPTTKPQVGKPGPGGVKPTLRLPPAGKTASTLLKNAKAGASLGSRGLGGVGLIISGIATAQDLAASLKRGEGYASLPKLAREIAKGKPKKTTGTGGKSNRRGRSTSKPETKPETTPKKTSSTSTPTKYPTTAVTQTRRGSRDYQAEKAAKTPPNRLLPADKVPSTPTRKPIPKTKATKSAISTYKEHGSDLHVGRHKTLKEHRAAVAALKKKKPQSP